MAGHYVELAVAVKFADLGEYSCRIFHQLKLAFAIGNFDAFARLGNSHYGANQSRVEFSNR